MKQQTNLQLTASAERLISQYRKTGIESYYTRFENINNILAFRMLF